MKRKSIICTILALALILMGTGYAFWTDTLNVTTKATTGDMDVTFVDLGLYAQYDNEYGGNAVAGDNWSIVDGVGDDGYVAANYFMRSESDYNAIAKPGSIEDYLAGAKDYNNVSFGAVLVDAEAITATVGPYTPGNTNGSDNILLTVDNIYPGYAQAFRSDILNVGTLAAKLSNIKVEVSNLKGADASKVAKDMLGIAVLVEYERYNPAPGEEGTNVFELCDVLASLGDDAFFTIGNVEFVRLSAIPANLMETIAAANTLLLPPNDNRMDIYVAVGMDPDGEGDFTTGSTAVLAKNDDTKSMNKGAKISIDLLWDQFNASAEDVDATNRLEEQNR